MTYGDKARRPFRFTTYGIMLLLPALAVGPLAAETTIPCLSHPVEALIDRDGVPHITAPQRFKDLVH